jgi:hypothetical protein
MKMSKKVTMEFIPPPSIDKDTAESAGGVPVSVINSSQEIGTAKQKVGKGGKGNRILHGAVDASMQGVGQAKSTTNLYNSALKAFGSFYLELKKSAFDISLVRSELETTGNVNVFENLLGAFANYLL